MIPRAIALRAVEAVACVVVPPLYALNQLLRPFIWLLNAVGYLVAFVAIKRGYSKDVLTYRGLTVAVIIGIIIGFIIGKLL